MDAKRHLTNLQTQMNEIFVETLGLREEVGSSHYYASCIYEFSNLLICEEERNILHTVAGQIESAALISAFGLYRQAFASLRLALEMGLGTVYFSVHRLELNEWLAGKTDIKWHQLIDIDKGVLSKRFANAFFKELAEEIEIIKDDATKLYRELSEFVHGNHETWGPDGLSLTYNREMESKYHSLCRKVFEIVMFALCCRYIKEMSEENFDEISFIEDEFSHIAAIREAFGGPKDIK